MSRTVSPLAVVALTAALAAGACAPWPAERGGGAAELAASWAPAGLADIDVEALSQRLDACSASLDELRGAGADARAPAAVAEARALLTRSRREAAGGLYADATLGVERAGETLERIALSVNRSVDASCVA